MARRCEMQTYDAEKAVWYLGKCLELGGDL